MLGRAMLTCDIDERWNGPPPRCESESPLSVNLRNISYNFDIRLQLLSVSFRRITKMVRSCRRTEHTLTHS